VAAHSRGRQRRTYPNSWLYFLIGTPADSIISQPSFRLVALLHATRLLVERAASVQGCTSRRKADDISAGKCGAGAGQSAEEEAAGKVGER
jgi:hypothetical protein